MKFVVWTIPLALIRLAFSLSVFLTPLLGVWLASSLIVFINGPTWLALLSGILLFPLLPVFWDWKARRSKPQRKGLSLSWGDRIALRTLTLNLAFIILLLALRPQTSFLALATRGDWFLENFTGSPVELTRQALFKTANGLEWLYLAFHHNPYQKYADSTTVQPQPEEIAPIPERPAPAPPLPQQTDQEWPWRNAGLHPAVVNIPARSEISIESVAQYIAQQEKDPVLRIKALHDYVADRIAYDAPAYFANQIPPQDPEIVFLTRKAVCAGYAKLLEALGKAIGEEIVYVVGDARTSTSELSGEGHAWNAAKIEGKWYLIDSTWDSGFVDESGFHKNYRTDYLLPPPQVMTITHLPDDETWQLLPHPLSRGEFFRQPILRPRFFAEGLELVTPTRSQSDISGDAVIEVKNPYQRWILTSYAEKGGAKLGNCGESASQGSRIHCPLPDSGTYEVRMFTGEEKFSSFKYVGQLEFNRR
ncbi:transglutaminase domain-containing protein [Spirulina subsalsa]|uniref:transglutaminase domain-containing protein n=1 Tax=Spirulina subsalsa TaxID=54311 RepID=UPI0003107EBF|nr:transglutaminase domain-containing protein [Spirulina subsalsa]